MKIIDVPIDNMSIEDEFSFLSITPEKTITAKTNKKFKIDNDVSTINISLKSAKWIAINTASGQPINMDSSGANHVSFTLAKGEYCACTDGVISKLGIEDSAIHTTNMPDISKLMVEIDAPSYHDIDGMAEIPADGQSFCTFNLSTKTTRGANALGSDKIFLRSSGGSLKSSPASRKTLRELVLKKGEGSFVFISETHEKTVSVEIMTRVGEKQVFTIEFIPVPIVSKPKRANLKEAVVKTGVLKRASIRAKKR